MSAMKYVLFKQSFSVSFFRDPRAGTDVLTNVEDVKDRIHNWDVLLKNIKAYYQVPHLQQYFENNKEM